MKLAQIDFYKHAQEQGLTGVPTDLQSPEDSASGFGNMMSSLLSGIMVLAALLVLFYLLWGAMEWIMSGGEKGKIEKARDKMTQAIIGLIVLSATLALFSLIQAFLGITIIDFGF